MWIFQLAFKKCFQVGSFEGNNFALQNLSKISRFKSRQVIFRRWYIAAFGTYPRENSLNTDGRFLHTQGNVSFSTAIVDEFSFWQKFVAHLMWF